MNLVRLMPRVRRLVLSVAVDIVCVPVHSFGQVLAYDASTVQPTGLISVLFSSSLIDEVEISSFFFLSIRLLLRLRST